MASGRPRDETAIREASQALARAFEKGDAKEVAGFWTAEGEYVDEGGEPVHGRAALEKAYAGFFAKRPELKVESRTESIRFLGDGHRHRGGDLHRPRQGRPGRLQPVQQPVRPGGGRWRIAMLKEWGDESTDRPSLEDLAWLIGTWESEGRGPRRPASPTSGPRPRRSSAAGSSSPRRRERRPASAGTQVIGVDPAEGFIRAWTFDPDGGFGEAIWAWDGERWAIDSDGTLADGSRTTALNFLTPAGQGRVHLAVGPADARRRGRSPTSAPVKVNRVREGK